jgi:hypothetical protein
VPKKRGGFGRSSQKEGRIWKKFPKRGADLEEVPKKRGGFGEKCPKRGGEFGKNEERVWEKAWQKERERVHFCAV